MSLFVKLLGRWGGHETMSLKVIVEGPLEPDDLAELGQAIRKIEQRTGGHYQVFIVPEGAQGPPVEASLWAWVGTDGQEVGLARLARAWIPLGTINLAGFHEATLRHPRLIDLLREQAGRDGETVRLLRFEAVEQLEMIEPLRDKPGGPAKEAGDDAAR